MKKSSHRTESVGSSMPDVRTVVRIASPNRNGVWAETHQGSVGNNQTPTAASTAPKKNFNLPHSNWSNHMYEEIFSAIGSMTKLPEGDAFHLDVQSGKRALNILGFIREQMRVEPPKIINQSGEAIVFTWEFGSIKKYLTVADDEVDVMHLNKKSGIRCEEVLTEQGEVDFKKLAVQLGAPALASSISE